MKNLYKVKIDPKKKKSMGKVSLVKNPAIQTMFVKMSEEIEIKLTLNEDKMIVSGPVLIPNQPIWRNEVDGYITFDKETINLLQSEYSKNNDLTALNIEHSSQNVDGYVKESWITGSIDKSQELGYDLPEGTWFMTTQITNKMLWNRIKSGEINGYSIEAVVDLTALNMSQDIQLESYTDYPQSVINNAKAVLEWVDNNGWGDCGTDVGKQRANQLANGEPISIETINRMYSYLSRHKVDLESSTSYEDGCGKLMYDAWGGEEALIWSENKLNEINKQTQIKMKETILQDGTTIYSESELMVDTLVYSDNTLTTPLVDGEYTLENGDMISVMEGKITEYKSVSTEIVETPSVEVSIETDNGEVIINLVGEKVSFDYDETLDTEQGQMLVKDYIDNGAEVYVLSARSDKEGMLELTNSLGINSDNVYACGSNEMKIAKITELGITKHYDNNSDVIDELGIIGIQLKVTPKAGENEKDFVSRCIGVEIGRGYLPSQAAAMCYSMFKTKMNSDVELTEEVVMAETGMTETTTTSTTISEYVNKEDFDKLLTSYGELQSMVADIQQKVALLETANTDLMGKNVSMSEQIVKLTGYVPESKRKVTLSKEDIDSKTMSKYDRIDGIVRVLNNK